MLELTVLSNKNGDKPVSTSVTDVWVGGQAARVVADGLALAKAATEDTVWGLFANDREKDVPIGKATVIFPGSTVILRPSTLVSGSVVYPYAESFVTYQKGDELVLDVNGKWTRTVGTSKRFLLVIDLKDSEGVEVFSRNI
jgi:hypothetical protein